MGKQLLLFDDGENGGRELPTRSKNPRKRSQQASRRFANATAEQSQAPRLMTTGALAGLLGQPFHRIRWVLDTRHDIRPAAYAGRARLYTPDSVARVRYELNRIAAAKEPQDEAWMNLCDADEFGGDADTESDHKRPNSGDELSLEPIPRFITSGVMAEILGQPLRRIRRILETQSDITPAAYAGNTRLYLRSAVERVRELLEMDRSSAPV